MVAKLQIRKNSRRSRTSSQRYNCACGETVLLYGQGIELVMSTGVGWLTSTILTAFPLTIQKHAPYLSKVQG